MQLQLTLHPHSRIYSAGQLLTFFSSCYSADNSLKATSGENVAQNYIYNDPTFLFLFPITSKNALKCSKGALVVIWILNKQRSYYFFK